MTRRRARSLIAVVAVAAVAALMSACGTATRIASTHSDPPVLVLWKRVGNVKLGESTKKFRADYGRRDHRHGGLFDVESNWGGYAGINWIYFTTPYYRTKSGFGVGSRFPRAWHGEFIWNAIDKGSPCHCWVKVGNGPRSLEATGANFGKPWVIVDMSHGRVSGILMSSKYLD